MITFTVKNDKGQSFEVDQDKVHEAEADGFLPVVSNGIQEHRVSSADISKAEADGYKPVLKSDMSKTESAVRGAVQGIPFIGSYADEATGALESAAGSLGLVPDKTYTQARDESRAAYHEAEDFNPKSFYSGLVGASLPIDVAKAVPVLGQAVGAVEGGAYGLGASEADLTEGDYSGAARDTAIGSAIGAVAPKVVGAVGSHVVAPLVKGSGKLIGSVGEKAGPKVSRAADWLLEKTGKVASDIPEEYTEEYLKREGKVAARPFEEIADDLSSQAEMAERNLNKAKDSLSESKVKSRDTEQDLKNTLRDEKFQKSNDLRDARFSADEAYQNTVRDLKATNLNNLGSEVTASLSDLKKKVIQGSNDAYDTLAIDGAKKYDIAPAIGLLNKGIKDLHIGGKAPVSDSAVNSIKTLTNLRDRLASIDPKVSGPQVKQILQQLDSDLEAAYQSNTGSFTPEADSIKKQIRGLLDQTIKTYNPEYAARMKEVAANSSLLNLASKSFGNDKALFSKLNNMGSNSGRNIDSLLLRNLGKKTGKDFETPINEYLSKQDLLKDPRAIRKGLPQAKDLSLLESEARRMQDPRIERGISEHPLLQSAAGDVAQKEAGLKSAEDVYDVFSGVNQNQVQSKMKALEGARDYAPKKIFEGIDDATGKNYSGEIHDRAILDSFNKGSTSGARKTVGGAAVGSAVGSVFGPVGAAVGAGIGGLAGMTADKYAGRAVKMALDTKIDVSDKLMRAVRSSPERFQKYGKVLEDASQRGGNALGVTHYLLQSIDPEYQKMMQEESEQ